MISLDDLKEYAKIKDYNLGQAEKDYYQEIILFILYREYGSELIFKGGTALTKCYGFSRFSEDLDFNCTFDVTHTIVKGLKRFNIEFEHKDTVFRLKGPLFNGNRNSFCKIRIDSNNKENVVIKPRIKTIGLMIDEIPSFDVAVMDEKEILAEKIRAIYKRDSARDIFDLYYLIRRGVSFDITLVNKKLEYYKLRFSKEFISRVKDKKAIWKTEMRNLTKTFPEWDEVYSVIKKFYNQ